MCRVTFLYRLLFSCIFLHIHRLISLSFFKVCNFSLTMSQTSISASRCAPPVSISTRRVLSNRCTMCPFKVPDMVTMVTVDRHGIIVACKGCVITYGLGCTTPGCLSTVNKSLAQVHHLLKSNGCVIPPSSRCTDCSKRTWYSCRGCNVESSKIHE